MRDHFVEPVGRLFPKPEVAVQQSRSNLACVIQIVQRRIGLEIKGERREQRQRSCDPKLPVSITHFVSLRDDSHFHLNAAPGVFPKQLWFPSGRFGQDRLTRKRLQASSR